MSRSDDEKAQHSILNSSFPVLVPYAKELLFSEKEFSDYLTTVKAAAIYEPKPETEIKQPESQPHPFVDGLLKRDEVNRDTKGLAADNKTLTANADVAFSSTKSALVDYFFKPSLGDSGDLEDLLNASWAEDAEITLKLIFHARSIHLGKADRSRFYASIGWLYKYHPRTLLENLVWLTRPIIAKKVKEAGKTEKPEAKNETKVADADDDDFELVVAEDQADVSKFDVKNGVSHGYWKDLLNVLVLIAEDAIYEQESIKKVLNNHSNKTVKPGKREWNPEKAKKKKQAMISQWHEKAVARFSNDATYRALHLTVARLFADQLRKDRKLLDSGDKRAVRHLSLAAKWAPSLKEFHDKHTFIASSIAEIFYRHEDVCPESVPKSDRQTYLKYAREYYRRLVLSPLRKALAVVERDISAETFERIMYERLPSLALDRYRNLFLSKDEEHFMRYIEQVAGGQKKVSGAVLLPSLLVSRARNTPASYPSKKSSSVESAQALMNTKLLDGQWKTLVQRIRDSGTLQSSIAVCDVSGSMSYPGFDDGTTPMDAAIGLSLLLAEVVEPPFGGCFITFSENPIVQKVGGLGDKRNFQQKVNYIQRSDWGMNTALDRVFERLLLPMAIENKVKQEDMVKQVFIFSDMQFDAATQSDQRWSSSFQRIQMQYEKAGYQMPSIVFWNLAGHDTGNVPVESDEPGVTLLSGYSHGQMKMFLDGGEFEDEVAEEEVKMEEEVANSDDEATVGNDEKGFVDVTVEQKKKTDPMAGVRKAISHPAYRMLKVVD